MNRNECIARLELITKCSQAPESRFHLESVVSDWNKGDKSRTYLSIVETAEGSKHYKKKDYGYFDNNSGEYVPGKADLNKNYDFSGSTLVIPAEETAEETPVETAEVIESVETAVISEEIKESESTKENDTMKMFTLNYVKSVQYQSNDTPKTEELSHYNVLADSADSAIAKELADLASRCYTNANSNPELECNCAIDSDLNELTATVTMDNGSYTVKYHDFVARELTMDDLQAIKESILEGEEAFPLPDTLSIEELEAMNWEDLSYQQQVKLFVHRATTAEPAAEAKAAKANPSINTHGIPMTNLLQVCQQTKRLNPHPYSNHFIQFSYDTSDGEIIVDEHVGEGSYTRYNSDSIVHVGYTRSPLTQQELANMIFNALQA